METNNKDWELLEGVWGVVKVILLIVAVMAVMLVAPLLEIMDGIHETIILPGN